MEEYKYIPRGKLETYVKFFWYSKGYQPLSKKERIMPNGTSQLIINLENKKFRHFEGPYYNKEIEYSSTVITGIHTHNIFLDSYSRISTINVVLRPTAVLALFGISAYEFKNEIVCLETILGSHISALRQRLIEAAAPEDKFKLLEAFLTHCLDHSFQPNPAIIYSANQIKDKNGIPTIAEIRDKVGYSRRRFSELFKVHVGVTPKQYARICRFQFALGKIRENPVPDWSSLIMAGKYYDQSHFIHDFKMFSGLAPTEYQCNKTDKINHLPA